MQEANPGPLTPPPFLAKAPSSRATDTSVFHFQNEHVNKYNEQLRAGFDTYAPFKPSEQPKIGFETYTCRILPESIQMSAYVVQNPTEMRSNFDRRYNQQ